MRRTLISIMLLLMLPLAFSCKKDNGTGIFKFPNNPNTIKCVGDIPAPKKSKRDSVEPGSFAEYLRNLPLKPEGYPTHLYNGTKKANQSAAFRVVDMDIDTVDLQQCADACIRLYAEYLWHRKQYDKIKFHFVSGFLADYERWAHGERIRVNEAQTHASWYRFNNREDYTYDTFRQYLLMVFRYAGTESLPKDLERTTVSEGNTPLPINIGDVIVQPGSPGHAVIVVDKAGDSFILAQSYMPAQEIEILKGSSDAWNVIELLQCSGNQYIINTPEWNFRINDNSYIMHFKN